MPAFTVTYCWRFLRAKKKRRKGAKAQRRKGAKAQKRRAIKRALSQNGKPQETSAALVSLCFKSAPFIVSKKRGLFET
jgi:hypothetical protein